jgi:hypothetical protein
VKVGVIHRISDPEGAQSKGQSLFEPQTAAQLLQFCPSQDFSTAMCIWDAESTDAVRDLVDNTLGETAEQTYFAIAADQAVGLPEGASARA